MQIIGQLACKSGAICGRWLAVLKFAATVGGTSAPALYVPLGGGGAGTDACPWISFGPFMSKSQATMQLLNFDSGRLATSL